MAVQFIIEDGTGKTDANPYTNPLHANLYLENSGRKSGVWQDLGSNGQQAALVNAWNYMLARWRGRWNGQPTFKAQAGDWPQRGQFYPSNHAVAHNEIPEEIEHAQIEYAYAFAVGGELAPVPEYDDSGRTVTGKTEKVDVLMEQTQFSDKGGSGRNVDGMRAYPIADGLLSWWTESGSSSELKRN